MNTLIRELSGFSNFQNYASLLGDISFDTMKDMLDNISETNLHFNNDDRTFKRKNPYNKLLAYKEEIDDEAQKTFTIIKANLGRAVMLREIYPGCLEATYSLYV